MLSQLREYVDACFTALWVQTHEPDEALAEIRRMAADNGWNLLHWDAASGLNGDGNGDPLAAVNALPAIGNSEQTGLIVFRNFHRFLNDIQVVQPLANAVVAGKLTRSFAVVLSPVVDIPVELEKLFVVIEHELPSKETLTQIAQQIGTEPGDLPEDLGPVVDAANGLTRYEAEGVYSLSLARHGQVRPKVVWDLKAQAIAKTGLARIFSGSERFGDLGGLDRLKWHAQLAAKPIPPHLPKGFVLVGPPGTGKSAIAKAMGNEMGLPTLIADLGSLMGSLVGQTEERTRQLFALIRQLGRCVVMFDEGNQQFGGSRDRHEVTGRLIGAILSFMQDSTSGAFFVLTANEVASLPGPLMRAGRMDAVYFVDLPGEEQREVIWGIHLAKYGLGVDHVIPSSEGWSGAEIEHCCRTAAMYGLTLDAAAGFVVPVATSQAVEIEALRQEAAKNGWLSAERPGPYTRSGQQTTKARRQVSRPSNN
ncbi:MAG: AAA family ATPase [Planctomycetia bacterium]|nr:AAA family ATPase [Planctomycetia bacterium]